MEQPTPVNPKKFSWKTIFSLLAVFVFAAIGIIVQVVLPPLVETKFRDLLRKQGAEQFELKEFSLRIIPASVKLKGLRIEHEEPVTIDELTIGVSLSQLLLKNVVFDTLSANGAEFTLNHSETDKLKIGPIIIPLAKQDKISAEDSEASEWNFQFDKFRFNDSSISYKTDEYVTQLVVEHLSLDDFDMAGSVTPIDLQFKGAWDGTNIGLESSIVIKKFPDDIDAEFSISASGLSQNERISSLFGKKPVDGSVQLDGGLKYSNAEVHLDGKLNWQDAVLPAGVASVGWLQGYGDIELGYVVASSLLEIKYDLSLQKADIDLTVAKHNIKANSLTANGSFTFQNSDFNLATKLWAENFVVVDLSRNLAWIEAGEFDAQQLRLDNTGLQISQAKAVNSHLLSDPLTNSTPVEAGDIELTGISMPDYAYLFVENVQLQKATLQVLRYADEAWALPNFQTVEDSSGALVGNEQVDRTQTPFYVEIGRLNVGSDSRLSFSDDSVQPRMEFSMDNLNVNLTHFTTQKKQSPAFLEMNASLGQLGTVQFNSELNLFNKGLITTFDGKMRNLDLTVFSGYTNKHLGYRLERGRLDADIKGSIAGDEVDVENKITIAKFNLIPASMSTIERIQKQLTMPLDTGINLMKDSNDTVKLSVPVTGQLSDPQFKYSQIFNTALIGAIKVGALQYAKYAFQPLGTALLAKKLVDKITEDKFDSIIFRYGKTELQEQNFQYLDRIAETLKANRKLQLTFCSFSVPGDLSPEKGQNIMVSERQQYLFELAETRRKLVFDYLTKQQGVKVEQLFSCVSKIDNKQDALPRIDINL